MNNIMNAIDTQIESCKNLLEVFQSERQIYRERKHIGTKDLMEILQRKKKLVEAFESQRAILKQMGEENESASADENGKKQRIRELAEILEQLLVIDQENEKLLREMLTHANLPAENVSRKARQRPALQRQMPLMPGNSPRPASAPAVNPSLSHQNTQQPSAETAMAQARVKSNIRKYSKINPLLQLDSKYV